MTDGRGKARGATRGSKASSDELLPCPFCGGEAELKQGSSCSRRWHVGCANPDCVFCSGTFDVAHDSEDAAIASWNRRAAATDGQFACAVHDGETWACVERALKSDMVKPIGGFTRDSVCRDSMVERDEQMERAVALMRDMYGSLRTVSEAWAYDGYAERLREFGIGGGE